MKPFLFILILCTVLSACTKDKRVSKCFWKGENWELTSVTVDDATELIDVVWTIGKCDIYEDLCEGTWTASNGDASLFNWQFNERAKEFKIIRVSANDTLCKGCNEADYFSYQFSGTYEVVKSKKKEMIFESESTVGYSGKKVKIVLERQ